jgi:hypothetical protein
VFGLPYVRILHKLHNSVVPPLPYPISEMNRSNWYPGGFQDWRRQRKREEFLKNATPLPFDQPEPHNLAIPNPPLANLPPAAVARPKRFKNGSPFSDMRQSSKKSLVPVSYPCLSVFIRGSIECLPLKAEFAQTLHQSHLLKPNDSMAPPFAELSTALNRAKSR